MPSHAGDMTLASTAFGVNEAIPSNYTCDGAGKSPPLEWKNVPANTAALVLFVIDNDTPGSSGGIRWVVGDISPDAKGVAEGQIPAGGIVGMNSGSQSNYGAICPPHGKTTRIEFVLYALSKAIPLAPGFQPAVAEREYGGASTLIIGQGAVTYAGYSRP